MCGIVGLARNAGVTAADLATVRSMGAWQIHRGPDAWGQHRGTRVVLGHNRLSVVDLEGGRQPMSSADGQVHVSFNGEIYNHRELRAELTLHGHAFTTHHSDTEVIVVGYRAWGSDVFTRLEGMFAIALWDESEQKLLLARDRSGIKPLCYTLLPNGTLLFASELKALLGSGLVNAEFDSQLLAEYFTFRTTGERAFIKGVKHLPPATYLVYSAATGVTGPVPYWQLSNARATRLSHADLLERVSSTLDDAVRSHLLADVPLGVCLSGGVDSSLLSSFASRTQRLSAFTIDTRSEYSELQHARTVARTLGLALFQLDVEPESFAQNFELWAYHNDDPVSDPSALALMLLMQHARTQGMKVMLSGEGADELFGGYNAYLRLWLVSHLSQGTPLAARHWLARSMSGRWRDYLAEPAALRYFGAGHMTTRALKHELLAPEILGSDAEELERTSFPLDPKQPNWLRQAMRWDHAMRLPYDVLARTDRATMAFSVEGRVPFLDRRVVELANQLPDSECFDVLRMTGKPLLKELAARAVPRSIIYRKKRGFDLPVGHWLRVRFAELSRSFLSERRVPGLNYAGVQRVFEAHVSRERDSSAPLWGWLVLEKWYRLWVLGTASPLPAAVAMAQDAQALLDPKPHDGMPSGDPIAARGLHP